MACRRSARAARAGGRRVAALLLLLALALAPHAQAAHSPDTPAPVSAEVSALLTAALIPAAESALVSATVPTVVPTEAPTHAAPSPATPTAPCRVVAIGFDGGHVLPEWLFRATFGRLKQEIRDMGRDDICVHTYPGVLSPLALRWVKARPGAKVILYGYSSGGWTAVRFARRLKHEGIPVELLVQIDTPWMCRGPVPSNVRAAANYYQRDTWFPLMWGSSRLRLEDPSATTLVANERVTDLGHFGLPNLPAIHGLILGAVDAAWKAAHPEATEAALGQSEPSNVTAAVSPGVPVATAAPAAAMVASVVGAPDVTPDVRPDVTPDVTPEVAPQVAPPPAAVVLPATR